MAEADFTIVEFLDWARTKPADERYRYSDPSNCALCKFLRDTARAVRPLVCPQTDEFGGWREMGQPLNTERRYPVELEPALKGDEDARWETFGQLVKRLEALLPAKSDWLTPQTYLEADCGEYVA